MTLLNLALVQEALKEYYLEGLRYQLNEEAGVFLAQLERDDQSVEGSKIVMALRYGRNGGVGNRADDGDLPTPNSRKTKQAKWETKNTFARFQITDKTVKSSRSNAGAFANLLEQEIADCETDVKQDLSRQTLGDGSGILAKATGVKVGSTVPVDTAMYLAEGMRVDIWDTSGAVWLNQNVTIDAVDDSNPAAQTITLSAVGVIAADDIFYVSGNKGIELTGLTAVFEAATIYGLTRADYPVLKAQRTNIAGEIAEVKIQKAIDDSERKAGGKINFLHCSYGVRRGYQNLLTLQKRLVNTMKLKGGWDAISYNGIPLAADKYIKDGKLYCLDLNDFKFYHMGDYEWLDADGAMLSRVANKAAWEATLVRYCDIGCQKPRGQVELYGITEH